MCDLIDKEQTFIRQSHTDGHILSGTLIIVICVKKKKLHNHNLLVQFVGSEPNIDREMLQYFFSYSRNFNHQV